MRQFAVVSSLTCLLVLLSVETLLGQTPLRFDRIQTVQPGTYSIELQGPTNRTLVVEASSNFVDWRYVWDAVPGTIPLNGIVTPIIDLGTTPQHQYLRALYVGALEDPAPLEALAGDASASANSVLPGMGMPSVKESEVIQSEGILPLVLPHILAIFSDTTTVQQVNDILLQENMRIAGSIPEANVVLLQDDAITTIVDLENRILQLESTGLFTELAPNIGMDLPYEDDDPIPSINTIGPPTSQSAWSWDVSPLGQGTGGNNAFELSRIPQLWNWLDYGHRQKKKLGGHRLAIMEYSFYAGQEDLPTNAVFRSGNGVTHSKRRHGTAVAGVIAANRKNEEGIQGVTPLLSQLEGFGIRAGATNSWSTAHLASISSLLKRAGSQRPQVINMSFGIPWGTNVPTANSMTAIDRLGNLWCTALGTINTNFGSNYLVFCSAGNDSGVDARYNSPMANIACRSALSIRVPNFMTVESVDGTGATSSFSNRDIVTSGDVRGQSVSAGGDSITVLAGPSSSTYRPSASGTSYASPFAAGVASFLWTLEPTLSVANVKFLLSHADTSRDVAGGANLIDAFAAALRIDLLKNGDPLQKALVDVDDGTLDGNLRSSGHPFEKSPDTIHTPDKRRGNGTVGMSDFRAFRDAFLESINMTTYLDGPSTHFKRDLNLDGVADGQAVNPPHPVDTITPTAVAGAPNEDVFARYDFNGNGRIDAGNLLTTPAAQDVSPVKVDPDTNCAGRDPASGCLVDLDVLLDPDIWEVTDENVMVEGGGFTPPLPGQIIPDFDWEPSNVRMTNLFYGGIPLEHVPSLWSCDLHISMESTDPNAPFDTSYPGGVILQADGLWVSVASLYSNNRGGEWNGVMTFPLYHPVYHIIKDLPVEAQSMVVQYKKTVGQEWRQYLLNIYPGPGEDILMELGLDKLNCSSTIRNTHPDFIPRSRQFEVLAKLPDSPPYATQVVPDGDPRSIFEIADELAATVLASRLRLPPLLGGGATIEAIYDTESAGDSATRILLFGIAANYE